MTKAEALKGLERTYHGTIYGYLDDDAEWNEYARMYTADFLYYPKKGIPMAVKVITEEDDVEDIAIHFSLCQEYKKYPLFLFLKPNTSLNAVFASNYNTACFSLTEDFRILPFRIRDKRILLAKEDYSLDDFICNPKYIFNQDKQWIIKHKDGRVVIVEDFDKRRNTYNCHLPGKIEFNPPERSSKEILRDWFYAQDYDRLFRAFLHIEEIYFRQQGILDYDEREDLKSDCNILIWEKILTGELYTGDNLPKYVQSVCFNILRARQRKYATRKAIIERNPSYLSDMRESRDPTYDEYVSTAPKQRRKSSLPTICVYDKITGSLLGEYESVADAAKATGTDQSNISKCLSGKRKSTGNFRFSTRKTDLCPSK